MDVIDEGLITKALYVNEGAEDNIEISNDYDCLLELADAKRKAIAQRYVEVLSGGKIVRPFVLIQFPNGQPETIKAVETKLELMGYTYDNGMVNAEVDVIARAEDASKISRIVERFNLASVDTACIQYARPCRCKFRLIRPHIPLRTDQPFRM